MSLKEKISFIDNSVINWLTAITWRIEAKWSKTNVDIAMAVFTVTFVFMFCTYVTAAVFLYQEEYMITAILSTIASILIFIGLISCVHDQSNIRKEILLKWPQRCPNPARKWEEVKRRAIVVLLITLVYLLYTHFPILPIWFWFITLLGALLYLYLLACDSLPPEERERLRKKKEAPVFAS